jgi:hypothetical protein
MITPERCFRITGRTARVTFIGPIRLVDTRSNHGSGTSRASRMGTDKAG